MVERRFERHGVEDLRSLDGKQESNPALLVTYTVRYRAEACVERGTALAFACALDAEARCRIARVVVRLAVNSRLMSEIA